MQKIKIDITKTAGFITDEALQAIKKEVVDGLLTLEKGTGKGNDFLGCRSAYFCW